MLQYRCDDQLPPQPPKPWTGDKKPDDEPKHEDEQEEKPASA